MLKILENENDCIWIINDKIIVKLNLNSKLRDLAKYLILEYNINRSDYGPIKFSLNDVIYENLENKLADIGIQIGCIIVVEFTTFPTYPMRPCTLWDRDHYTEYPDGIRFQLTSVDKCKFLLEQCLAKTRETGSFYIDIIKYRLTKTDNPFEIRAIQNTFNEIENLTDDYISEIKATINKIEIPVKT